MPKQVLSFAPLPLYSITSYKTYLYLSGGGGGKTGIPNQILVYYRKVGGQPVRRFSTQHTLYQNMTISMEIDLLLCSANQKLIGMDIRDGGKVLQKLWEIPVDESLKNATINSIVVGEKKLNGKGKGSEDGVIIGVGGDDCTIRFFRVHKQKSPELVWHHNHHREPIRKIDSKHSNLFVSTDTEVAIVVSLTTKEIVHKVYRDELDPYPSLLQGAYFVEKRDASDNRLLLIHYIPRKNTYLTLQLPNCQNQTLLISTDQSCLTSKQGDLLGIACGGGTTYLVDVKEMGVVGVGKGHEAVVTAGAVTRGGRFVTGTSSCSYFVMEPGMGGSGWGRVFGVMVAALGIMVGIGMGLGAGLVQEL